MVDFFRKEGKTVGIVAVDPTSPFTGGAILGDRIRMQRHSTDEGVFIRSLATRGCLGGLSRSTQDIVNVMDAMGKEIILVETVGVGQDEVEIVNTAHTSIVVLVPAWEMTSRPSRQESSKSEISSSSTKVTEKEPTRWSGISGWFLKWERQREKDWTPLIFKTEAILGKGISELIQGISPAQAGPGTIRGHERKNEGKGEGHLSWNSRIGSDVPFSPENRAGWKMGDHSR